ncbi:hypothetical protein IQ235_10835 [Oscillatoriales cyanobacterium LEGE 11467]|uniref:Hpr(Ser) kinase/phosphatase n=1 Tax=Zarconia navalis LEGE 11467 TaxID=1828826 RepID=A0A928Z867_9CYAN|nr:hypothetical protein [Zarconia navalis]MBE9041275.1 hypothetical protein [Zarconia navalis LEGE 11467]
MYRYQAYGLGIHSKLALPELVADSQARADVIVEFAQLNDSPLNTDDTAHCFESTEEGMYVFWKSVGTFFIQQGRTISIDPDPDADADRLRLFILGAAIGVILHQRGYFVLHASAVEIDGKAAVFIGNKGWGKSTMAATLHARGHRLIGDDVVALDLNDNTRPVVLPAFPQLKLWPDAVESLGGDPENLPRLVPHLEKRDRRVREGFIDRTVPLGHIFLLGKGETVEIRPLEPQRIVTYLLQNSYVTRFGSELLQAGEAAHFLRLVRLARSISIERLLRPSQLFLLPTVARLVEERIAGEALKV